MEKNNKSDNWAEKVAIITGGTRGIGLAISRALARKKVKLLLVYHQNEKAAHKAEEELKDLTEVKIMKADLKGKQQAENIAASAGDHWGKIDILINNAGIFDYKTIEDMSPEFFEKIYSVNLKGPLFLMQAVLPWMKRSNCGRIINATSISGHFADIGLSAYGCSKAGIDMVTRIGSAELAPYGITVNAYAPGIIETGMTRDMLEEHGDTQVKQISLQKFGRPEDVSGLIKFLCSDEASYITGEIIGVDGGMFKVQNPDKAYN